ncbi:hypothetical protein [Collimonas fungivorans]|uniref:hypothetical protein n=1 Tax=Collimonas fungivorans TaxID=158899 RepID=UPI003FA3ACFF
MDYTINAKPTMYQGISFRSRLEAIWAAYFNIHAIKWRYEPRIWGLKNWLPDFALDAEFCNSYLLVEVKPVSDNSTKGGDFNKALGHGRTVLLLGASPKYVWLVPMDCEYRRLQEWLSCRGIGDGESHSYDSFRDGRAVNWMKARERVLYVQSSYQGED